MRKKKPVALPKTVLVLGREFHVIETDEPIMVDGQAASGSCNSVDRIIEIEKGLPFNEKMGILAHEMGHAGLDISGLGQTFSLREIEVFCQLQRSLVEDFVKAFQ